MKGVGERRANGNGRYTREGGLGEKEDKEELRCCVKDIARNSKVGI